jgi:hypothetical protein
LPAAHFTGSANFWARDRAYGCLAKSFGTEKAEGEEKCRLFGIWGGVRFVHSQFSFVSSRILRRKKAWLAGQLNINDNDGLKTLYRSH